MTKLDSNLHLKSPQLSGWNVVEFLNWISVPKVVSQFSSNNLSDHPTNYCSKIVISGPLIWFQLISFERICSRAIFNTINFCKSFPFRRRLNKSTFSQEIAKKLHNNFGQFEIFLLWFAANFFCLRLTNQPTNISQTCPSSRTEPLCLLPTRSLSWSSRDQPFHTRNNESTSLSDLSVLKFRWLRCLVSSPMLNN